MNATTSTPPLARRIAARWPTTGLAARWPTALALIQSVAVMPVIVLVGADVEFAPGVAIMAGIYMAAYAIGRPVAAWAAFPVLVGVCLVLVALGASAAAVATGMTVVLVLLWGWAIWRGRARDASRWFPIQTAGMLVFGAITVLAVLVDQTLGGVLVGIGFFGHGIWDAYHFAQNKIVNRPWAEMCFVVDIVVGVALIVASLVGAAP